MKTPSTRSTRPTLPREATMHGYDWLKPIAASVGRIQTSPPPRIVADRQQNPSRPSKLASRLAQKRP